MTKPIGNINKVQQNHSSVSKGNSAAGKGKGAEVPAAAPVKTEEKKPVDNVNISTEAKKESSSTETGYKVPDWIKESGDKSGSDDAKTQIDKFKSGSDKVYENYNKARESAPSGQKDQLDRALNSYRDQQSRTVEKQEKEEEKTKEAEKSNESAEKTKQNQAVQQDAQVEETGNAKGKGKGKGNGGTPPGLAKKGGVPPGQAKKSEEGEGDGKKVPPGLLKKELGLQNASEIAKNQDAAISEIDKAKTDGATKTTPETDGKDAKSATDKTAQPESAVKEPEKTEAVTPEKTDTTQDLSEKSPDTIKTEAAQEAKAEANTPEAQANLAVEKEAIAHTKIEAKRDVENITLKAGGDVQKIEIDQLKDRLEDLEAYEAGEDTARMLRGTPLKDDGIKSSDIKKTLQEKAVNPNSGVNWDDVLKNDCNAVMMEITQGKSMGVNNKASIPPIGLSAINGNEDNQKQGPGNYHQAIPGGALGKLIKSYQEASSLGGQMSQQTRDTIQSTLKIAGLGDITSLQTELPGRPLNSFFLG